MKKKILFLIHDLNCGGAEKVLIDLVNNLDCKKYDITVQTLFDFGVLKDKLNSNINYKGGLKKMFRGNVLLSKLFTPEQLCKYFIREKYDVVISYLEGQCCRILSAYNGKKIAWIHIEHNSIKEIVRPFNTFDEAKRCYDQYDKIVCVSKTVEDNFNSYFNLENKTQVIYNVVDNIRVLDSSKEHQKIINPDDANFNIVSVGRLTNSQKGFDRLVRIHHRLICDGINNNLYIIGDGKNRRDLEKIIYKLGVQQTVKLIGFDVNPYKFVKNADLYVCSSYKEGLSTACTEALILGVPVISTNVSGSEELINNGCGIVCENNEEALYEAIKKVLINKKLLDEYKEKAKIRSELFSVEQNINIFEKLINY